MNDILIIEGKQYISSRRAAEMAAYSNDYVGQLCRSGKLLCRMVGRFWYVDEESLLKHKKESIKPNQTVFKKVDFLKGSPVIELTPATPLVSPIISPSIPAAGRSMFDREQLALLTPTLAVVILLAVIVAVGNPRLNIYSSGRLATANVTTAVQSAERALVSAWDSLSAGVGSLVSRFGSGGESGLASSAPVEPSPSSVIPRDETGKVTAEHGGLVIMPTQGSTTDDRKLEASIQNSFSDTVMIKPNADGTTGVIQPVFRTVAGHDFLYVLVPVKATSTTAVN